LKEEKKEDKPAVGGGGEPYTIQPTVIVTAPTGSSMYADTGDFDMEDKKKIKTPPSAPKKPVPSASPVISAPGTNYSNAAVFLTEGEKDDKSS